MDKLFSKILVLLLVTATAYPQSAQRSDPERRVKLSTELIVLDAQVLSKKAKREIAGLSEDDFAIYEDGVRQQITHFSRDQAPLSIVLLVDVSASVLGVIEQIKKGALGALQQLRPGDEVALMSFATEAVLIQGFTQDRRLISDKIARVLELTLFNGRPDGTHISDNIYDAANQLHKAANPASRRIIIAVTDNDPYETWLAHSRIEVMHELFESGAVVYGLIVPSGYKTSKLVRYHPIVALINKRHNKGGKVDEYANHTGGVVLDGRKENLEAKLIELIEIIRSRYSFGYVSSYQKRDGKFRKIKLKVSPGIEKREGGVIVITRKGYYARTRDSRR